MKEADSFLPRFMKQHEKDWWTMGLSQLKQQSIEIQRLWIAEGRLQCGPTYFERLRVRAAYKRALRSAQIAPKQKTWNSLHTAMGECDSNNFWRSWKSLYNKNSTSFAPVVDGCTSDTAIADAFHRNSEPNNRSKVEELNRKFKEKYAEFSDSHSISCNCINYQITINNVIDGVAAMTSGKCADEEGFTMLHLRLFNN